MSSPKRRSSKKGTTKQHPKNHTPPTNTPEKAVEHTPAHPKGRSASTAESGLNLPAILSALAVLAVLGGLGFWLFTRNPQDATIATTPPPEVEQAALDAVTSQQNLEATAAAANASEPTVVAAAPATERQTYTELPPMTIDPANEYIATISTPRGDIVAQLRPDLAPQTVNSFVFLAREGFYDGLTWHRVLQDFMAQGGDPLGDGTGGAGYNVPAEFTNEVSFDRPGILAMARANDPDSASSQFFITTAPAPWLDGQYTVFGEVIEGQEIVNAIPLRDPMLATEPGEQILAITIEERES